MKISETPDQSSPRPRESICCQADALPSFQYDCVEEKNLLRQSEQRLRDALNCMSDGQITLDRNMVVTFFNKAAERFLGRNQRNVLGRHLFHDAFPEAAGSIFERNYNLALREQKPVEFETYFGVEPYEDWYHVRAFPHPEGLSVYFRIITDQKQSEEALLRESKINASMADLAKTLISKTTFEEISRILLDQARLLTSSPVGFIGCVDEEEGALRCPAMQGPGCGPKVAGQFNPASNTGSIELTSSFRLWISKHPEAMIINDPQADPRFPSTLDGQMPVTRALSAPVFINEEWAGQVVLANSDQPYTNIELELLEQMTSLYAMAIQRTRIEVVLSRARISLEERVEERTSELVKTNTLMRHEISEREQAEAARTIAENELEQQQLLTIHSDRLRSLGEMAAGIAHELNQPLAGVRGMAEHLLLGRDRNWDISESDIRERLTLIIEQADRMSHIINHVRLFAREAANVETRLVEINDVVRSATDMLSAQFQAHGMDIVTVLSTVPSTIRVNPFSLEEVLLNLLTNARDAIEETQEIGKNDASSTIEIRSFVEATERPGKVMISVTDSGVGIGPDHIEKVFDPFFTTKAPQKGTGLGLAISKSIVAKFDGEIEVRSIPNEQTTFTVILPVANDSRQSADETTPRFEETHHQQ